MNCRQFRTNAHIDHEMTELSKCCLRTKYTNNEFACRCFYYDYIKQKKNFRQEKEFAQQFITIFTYLTLIWCTIGTFFTTKINLTRIAMNSGKKTL